MIGHYKISPSILSSDLSQLGHTLKELEAAGADWIHIDVMDGHFVPGLTVGPVIVNACHQVSILPLDVHLMTDIPDKLIEDFAKAGANILTIHEEACPNTLQTLQNIQSLGMTPGIAINPDTPVSKIVNVIDKIGMVLVMLVDPRHLGKSYIDAVLPKIHQVRVLLNAQNPSAELQVDGGIDFSNASILSKAGATVFVAGSSIFKSEYGIREAIRRLRNNLKSQ